MPNKGKLLDHRNTACEVTIKDDGLNEHYLAHHSHTGDRHVFRCACGTEIVATLFHVATTAFSAHLQLAWARRDDTCWTDHRWSASEYFAQPGRIFVVFCECGLFCMSHARDRAFEEFNQHRESIRDAE
jgi:hypothetical protein